jgi:hypothetical protein
MSEPTIIEIQEHIIEMDGIQYRLYDVSSEGKTPEMLKNHWSFCWKCDGNEYAPREDMDRYRIFDHYCHGHHKTLRCDPNRGIVYKRVLG